MSKNTFALLREKTLAAPILDSAIARSLVNPRDVNLLTSLL